MAPANRRTLISSSPATKVALCWKTPVASRHASDCVMIVGGTGVGSAARRTSTPPRVVDLAPLAGGGILGDKHIAGEQGRIGSESGTFAMGQLLAVKSGKS